jgi:acetyl-CoA synthetase
MGKAVPGHTVAVIGLDGRVLKPGETWPIAVKSPDPVMFLE